MIYSFQYPYSVVKNNGRKIRFVLNNDLIQFDILKAFNLIFKVEVDSIAGITKNLNLRFNKTLGLGWVLKIKHGV